MLQFKWTQQNETLLEEILMKHYFDFISASKEFSQIINDSLSKTTGGEQVGYQIDAKSLQLRWTDIEIRKYRLNQGSSQPHDIDEEELKEEEKILEDASEDDLPPLEENPDETTINKASSSEDEGYGSGGGKVAHYTNLDELD